MKRRNLLFALLVTALLILNLGVLLSAVPETSKVDGGCCSPGADLAKDFSAYYTAAWALLHSPSQVYSRGVSGNGAPDISPAAVQFKYLPSFLLIVSPLTALPYGEALLAFDYLQFLLLPAIAALVYYLARERGLLATSAVAVAVLLLPLAIPAPQWTLSASYYWQWAEGQAKVLETFLLLLAFAFAKRGVPRAAGITLGLAFFDPRFALLGLPLMAAYGRDLRKTAVWTVASLCVTNAALAYPPTLGGFLSMVFTSGASTPPYYYAFIPLAAIGSLTLLERREVAARMKAALGQANASLTSYPWSRPRRS